MLNNKTRRRWLSRKVYEVLFLVRACTIFCWRSRFGVMAIVYIVVSYLVFTRRGLK